ncbi:MAG: type 1 glutamine amidotransferase [Alphaproteobacteria bacterium]
MRVLVIQNCTASEPGVLGEVLSERGAEIVLNDAERGDMPPASDEALDGLIVLGGPMNAEEDHLFPHLPATAALIRRFHHVGKPLIGVCLGSQLAARAFGKKVHRHGGHERGFRRLEATAAAATDPVIAGLAPDAHLFEWHEDTFDLPDEAVLLLTGADCRNQAFRVGDATYAFQCHIEVTPDLFAKWSDCSRDTIARLDPDFPDRMAVEMPRHFPGSRDFCRHVAERWTDLVAERRAANRRP